MKQTLKLAFALLALLTISLSCDKDESTSSGEIENSAEVNNTLEMSRGGSTDGVLFRYNTPQEAEAYMADGLGREIENLQAEVRTVPNAVGFSAEVVFSNGKVILDEYGFIDSHNNYIEHHIYNENEGGYETNAGGPAASHPCHGGGVFLGTCSNLSSMYYCISSKMTNFRITHLDLSFSSIGHGVSFSFNSGANGVDVCGTVF